MMTSFSILNPGVREAPSAASMDVRQVNRAKPNVALLSNRKPNVDQLFAGLIEGLGGYPVGAIRRFEKEHANIPVPEPIRAEIIATSDLVVSAMAD